MSETKHSGGCQCGAVRFAAHGDEFWASLCHFRMCQKQTGSYFGAFATFDRKMVEWTRGELSYFQSSNIAKRGFCKNCGTPLTYEQGEWVSLSVGAFDHPETVKPSKQLDFEARIHSFDTLHQLRVKVFENEGPAVVNHQHPDHDTKTWPEE